MCQKLFGLGFEHYCPFQQMLPRSLTSQDLFYLYVSTVLGFLHGPTYGTQSSLTYPTPQVLDCLCFSLDNRLSRHFHVPYIGHVHHKDDEYNQLLNCVYCFLSWIQPYLNHDDRLIRLIFHLWFFQLTHLPCPCVLARFQHDRVSYEVHQFDD